MIERVELFQTKKDLFLLFTLFLTLLSFSLSYEYYKYYQLTKFDSALIKAKVQKQYLKTKITKTGKEKTYQLLQLKSFDGFTFYTTAKKNFQDVKGEELELEIFIDNLSFYQYMKSFFAFSRILQVTTTNSNKEDLKSLIAIQHQNKIYSEIYEALYLATPLPKELQTTFSNLGLSHLIAISGFHLGIISALLFFLLKYPYKFFQNNYFPYRNHTRDIFIIISFVLLFYTLFLDTPPSLLRAYVMLVIGFLLYDRGIKIISMQTLFLTVLLIIAVFPRLFFSIGFWLSVAGVGYIFLFLIYFQEYKKLWQFLLLPLFVYLMMLPYSLTIFGNFSFLHPLSIIYTMLFTVFYPLTLLLHVFGFGGVFDPLLEALMATGSEGVKILLDIKILEVFIIISLGSILNRYLFFTLNLFAFFIFIYAINNVT
ncbi:ComEC/Rec2 family competence protein [Sulfurimonas sp. C5]|uniref:ComEC/Rec2 family competence protein n=1 Tax=Sulfurimonas sp. C5 TaxID=3036947 RepID=UPI0024567040|nr:ComEC/Rec2 family competence protein [Sulfurimonas sp. C5]MDH4944633.1 ComEC/Rec2 family competence protein [Sulfurimonas sp. C5]